VRRDVVRTIAELLTDLRARRGWPLRELAQRSGLSIAYLSELERGRKLPTLEALDQLAAAFDFNLAAFLRLLADRLEEPTTEVRHDAEFQDLDPAERSELACYAEYLRWRRSHCDQR
jgi:transcriptional regulator with XRE-family HTH domain